MTLIESQAGGTEAAAEPPAGGSGQGPRGPHPAWRVGMVVAVCFLAGAIGYALGVRQQSSDSGIDRGFLFDMATHHEQALRLANLELTRGAEPLVQVFAREVLTSQSYELGLIDRLLDDRGLSRQDRPPDAMAWMGMSVAPSSMPGMATADALAAFADAAGPEADAIFLRLLEDHHQGGIHMARAAAEDADDPVVGELAVRIARNQRIEVEELRTTRSRFDLPAAPLG